MVWRVLCVCLYAHAYVHVRAPGMCVCVCVQVCAHICMFGERWVVGGEGGVENHLVGLVITIEASALSTDRPGPVCTTR